RVASSQRALATQQFNDVRKLTTSILFEFDNAIQNLPGSTPARELLVQRALEYLNKLSGQARADASLQRELAEAYLKVGDVQGNPYVANLGETAGAEQSYRKALDISQQLTQLDPSDLIAQLYLARSYKSLGQVLPNLGKPTEAVADLRQATNILDSLAARNQSDKELRFQLANSYQMLGDLQGHSGIQNIGDLSGSQTSYKKALALYQSMLASDSSDARAQRGAAVVQIRLGDLQSRNNPKDAMTNYRNALATVRDLITAEPNNAEDQRMMALAYRKIGGIDESLNNPKEALQNYLKASASSEAAMRSDPQNAQAKMNFAISLRYVGDLLYNMGDRSGAIANYRQVTQILQGLSASEPGNVLVAGRYSEILVVLGGTLAERGKLSEARGMTSRGLAIAKSLGVRGDATADELFEYAESFLTCNPIDLREPRTAVEYATRAVEKSSGASDYLDQLARAYFQSGDFARAVETEQKALTALTPDSHNRKALEARLLKYKTSANPN
ncbi:MAG: tetratricopeptide repeat protein, partial [Acidobacteriaceae bacterium]|nr:tetratricopeptide repeat protein [Acidobacteriaceae bacterium]